MIGDRGRSIFLQQCAVSRETLQLLDRYAELLIEENGTQNLIAKSTEDDFWTRHILDSAQLFALTPANVRTCLDVGSGAGLPGIVLAAMSDVQFTLVEPRRRRAEFLRSTIQSLKLDGKVRVLASKVEQYAEETVDMITARAFTRLSATIDATRHAANMRTVWLLPKGRSVASELAEAKQRWTAKFDVIPSLTDPDAAIVKVSNLQAGQP